MNSLVQLENVSLSLNQRPILKQVNLALKKGEILSVIGPNGAGKTSLVKVLVGLVPPTTGKVIRNPALRIGYMPQRLQIDPLFPLAVQRFLEIGNSDNLKILPNVVAELGIAQALKTPLHALSGGELQRVLLARALLRQPELLVLDEPAQGVDLIGQSDLYNLISKIRDQYGCGVLLVSHDLNVVMAQTDFVVCLNQHICCKGSPEKVSRDPAFTALFGSVAQHLAFYTHHHDHHHDVQGIVCIDHKDHSHE